MTAKGPPLGLERGVVRLAEYDARWPALYDAEVARIKRFLGGLPLRFEHAGSTAVPGLVAKPIIDMLVGYDDRAVVPKAVAGFQAAGYDYQGENGVPGRDYFRRGDPRLYHVHMVRIGEAFWHEHLAFRDVLRAEPAVRDAYAALKRDLAARYRLDRDAYLAGKDPFIRDAVARRPPAARS